MSKRLVPLAALLFACSMQAATFVISGDDRVDVRGAEAIVVASALESHAILTDKNAIETVTTMSIEEVIKGPIDGETFEVIEPGGVYDDRLTAIPGIPRFQDGERTLLFLVKTPAGWRVRNIALGKFSFATDQNGRKLLVRDEQEIVGFDANGASYEERRRAAAEFLEFVRTEARGGMGKENYFVAKEPFAIDLDAAKVTLKPKTLFTPQSYVYTTSRWNVFPGAVSFFSVGTEPGAPGNGTTAIMTAFDAWKGDANSNVNLVYLGQDTSGLHNGGVSSPDGQNTIVFEADLQAELGVPQWPCNNTNGVLGAGGTTNGSGSHAGPGGTWATTTEGDVEMNKGIKDCPQLFTSGDFNTDVTHEVGHTLSLKHSDQSPSGGTCNPATEECEFANAVMKSFITQGINATLQTYDHHAVSAIYPSGPITPPGTPTGVVATASSTSQIGVSWTAVGTATSYEVYRRAPGGSFELLASTLTNSYNDSTVSSSTSYLYRVRALNAGGSSADSAADLATTILFTTDPLSGGTTVITAGRLTELRNGVNAVRALAGLGAGSYTDGATAGVLIKAVHVSELRTQLDAARGPLGFSTGGYTDSMTAGVLIKAVHFQELRNRVK